jgi:enoyl-CoA hydratase/carnithine racemase
MDNLINDNFNLEEYLKLFTTLKITILEEKKILIIALNRPKQLNALNEILFTELGNIFKNIERILEKIDIRVIILKGEGNAFSSGLDLKSKIPQKLFDIKASEEKDIGRKAFWLYGFIKKLQESLLYIENCPLPVIASIHGFCLGGSSSILSFCDFRISTKDAVFSIKEVDIGLTADLGFIQRIVKQTGKEGLMRKLSYTGEQFLGDKAFSYNLIDQICENIEELEKETFKLAEEISKKSPVILWGIKRMFNFSRDNSQSASLDMVATMNSGLVQGEEMMESISAFLEKRKVKFPKL